MLGALAACQKQEEQAKAPPPAVSVAGIQEKTIRESTSFIGQVAAIDKVSLVARVSGFLEDKAVQDGKKVKKDELVFKIEKDQYVAAVDKAKADLASAQADAALKAADLNRDRDLYQKGHISEAAFQSTQAQKAQADASVQGAQAALEQAQLNLSYTDISAPFDGLLGKTTYSVGEVVGPSSQPLATLIRVAPVYVNFAVSEAQYLNALKQHGISPDNIKPENTPNLSLILPNGDKFDETGKVVFIDNKVDPKTGTISFRGLFDNKNWTLLDGTFVNVVIESKEEKKELVVPQAAVQRDQRGSFVLVVNAQNTVEQRYVDLGAQVDTDFVVKKGLQSGEKVIVQGLQKVRPGVPVNASLASKPAE
ncbi:efflux RND transporter periplasmic adaptor subunit [Roseibium aggregatum]|nr:efflux RND transporter periplasmic adaptor subunit [Roseibium aggregatum]